MEGAASRVCRNYRIVYLTRGRGRLRTYPGAAHELESGNLVVLFPGLRHRFESCRDAGWECHFIEVGGDVIQRLLRCSACSPERPVLRPGLDGRLSELFAQAGELLRQRPAGFELLAGALGVQIVAHALAASRRPNMDAVAADRLIDEARELLTRPEFADMRLERLAARFRVAYSTFRRRFKERTGRSPRQYALEASMVRAKHLLTHSDIPVHRVAVELGFPTIAYFSRLFKRKTGLTPTEWRLGAHSDSVPREGAPLDRLRKAA